MNIKESGENYLETILILQKKKGVVRSVDIASELGYSKSSVSRAVNLLKERGYIEIDAKGVITFTDEGNKTTVALYERHKALSSFLELIGVDREIAEEDACKIEHVISEQTYLAIKNCIESGKMD